jgi:ribosomal protein S18 acetylase RimI-like enzyme
MPLRGECWPDRDPGEIARLVRRARSIVRQNCGLGLVVQSGGAVVGYGQLTLWPRRAEISDLIVAERWRGRGFGTALIQHLTRAARRRAAPCLEIGADETNTRALALYRRLGFDGRRAVSLSLGGCPVTIIYLTLALGPGREAATPAAPDATRPGS